MYISHRVWDVTSAYRFRCVRRWFGKPPKGRLLYFGWYRTRSAPIPPLSARPPWAPAGTEPAASSTYQVTYRYNVAVVPDSITPTAITVSGGVAGTQLLVTYKSKLPRTDLLCLNDLGDTAYVKGVSARKGAVPPIAPTP